MENYFNRIYSNISNAGERFLFLLKMKGPQTVTSLAAETGITAEGARLHLVKLTEDGLVLTSRVSKGVGRPQIQYSLTPKGLAYFPDAHTDLTVQLLESIGDVFGQEAMAAVLAKREKALDNKYSKQISPEQTLEEKLTALANIKTQEGYMAEWKKDEDGYLFIENHCPICMAAKTCGGLCDAEMSSLRKALGNSATIERTEHIIEGSRRCVYKVS